MDAKCRLCNRRAVRTVHYVFTDDTNAEPTPMHLCRVHRGAMDRSANTRTVRVEVLRDARR